MNRAGGQSGTVQLHEVFNDPLMLRSPNRFDEFVRGLTEQAPQRFDNFITESVSRNQI